MSNCRPVLPRWFFAFPFVVLFVGCANDSLTRGDNYHFRLQEYFLTALFEERTGFPGGRTLHRWEGPVTVCIQGEATPQVVADFDAVLMEIRQIIPSLDIRRVQSPAEANTDFFVLPVGKWAATDAPEEHNFARGISAMLWVGNQAAISRAKVWFDPSFVSPHDRKGELRAAMIPMLGFYRFLPNQYPIGETGVPASHRQELLTSPTESVGFDTYSNGVFGYSRRFGALRSFSETDREMLRLLYHPSLRSGLTFRETRALLPTLARWNPLSAADPAAARLDTPVGRPSEANSGLPN